MSTKIPSSLKWLIDKRARLEAEIRKTESSVKKAQALINDLSDLKQKLAAIDEALSMHEIQINIDLIQPVRSHYVRINLKYGDLTKSILMCLRLNGVGVPVRTSDIVEFIAARHADLEIEPQKRSKLGYIILLRPALNASIEMGCYIGTIYRKLMKVAFGASNQLKKLYPMYSNPSRWPWVYPRQAFECPHLKIFCIRISNFSFNEYFLASSFHAYSAA